MRFRVEQIYLTDQQGRVIPSNGRHPQYHVVEAATVDELIMAFVQEQGGTIVGDVLKFPGFQAVATVRNEQSVYTLQVLPSTDRLRTQEPC